MQVIVTGSSGLIGSALVPALAAAGHQVTRLVRAGSGSPPGTILWDPENGKLDAQRLDGFSAVVHLAGESIASGRWTAARKERIRDSRVKGTRLLCEALAKLSSPPKVLISASAIGFYGDRGDEVLTEESPAGRGFLADVCRAWEAETRPAVSKGIRVVLLRTGMVLSAKGGALAKMLTPFRLGVGGTLGSGRQYMSWIALADHVGIIMHALNREEVSGPLNAVSPQSVTNLEYTKTLGRVLGRPTMLSVPAFAARLAFGEMADELLLSSTRVEPAKLKATRYSFQFPQLEAALRAALAK